MAEQHFSLDMTIADAFQVHPSVPEVFASFNLGGCAFCHIAKVETLGQVCENYGIDSAEMLTALEGLMVEKPVENA